MARNVDGPVEECLGTLNSILKPLIIITMTSSVIYTTLLAEESMLPYESKVNQCP